MYAIVDIETTGGHASANGITEIAILVHDGEKVTERFETLIDPGMDIPVYIRALTGITNEMVSTAPSFDAVAAAIYELLHDKIFVAHNVNFDYSFLKFHLNKAGYQLNTRKLCTVRLGRKIIPGLPSYSLGKLCKHLNIVNLNPHRAGGDADATAIFFTMLVSHDQDGHIRQALNPRSHEQSLPPHLSRESIDNLPARPGVYYFHDQKAKVLYVGKAKNLKKRVSSHFSNNNPGRKKQEFLRHIHSITYRECGTELIAFILEAIEIKRLWPPYNWSQKRFEQAYGLYAFEDQRGYLRLAVDKFRKSSSALHTFNSIADGYSLLRRLSSEFNLCPKLCFIQRNNDLCAGIGEQSCRGACRGEEMAEAYNQRVYEALNRLKDTLPTFAIVDEGRSENEQSCILIEKGRFYGLGYIEAEQTADDLDSLKNYLQVYPGNDYIRNMIQFHAHRYPHKKRTFSDRVF